MNTAARSNGTDAHNGFSASPGAPDPRGWVVVDGYDVHQLARSTPTHDVFFAYHRPTGSHRELIVVHHFPSVDRTALRNQVESEVAHAGTVSHPGIAPVEDVGLTDDGRLFVAVARPVGRSLHEILARDGRLPVRRAFDLGHALVTAVTMAHARGLTHGRLTPESIVVADARAGWPERVVVLGFGTDAAQGAGLAPGALADPESAYLSPERAAGEPPSPRADVFSLGALLLSMLTGSTPSAVRATGTPGGPTGEHAEPTRGPGDIEQVLRRARAADPAARYASASELGAALWAVDSAWFESEDDTPAPGTHGSAPLAGSPGRRQVLVAAGLVGILAAGGAGLVWRGRRTPAGASPTALASQRPATAVPASLPPIASTTVHDSAGIASSSAHADSNVVRLTTAWATPPERRQRDAAPPHVAAPGVNGSETHTLAVAEPVASGPAALAPPAPVTNSSGGEVAGTRSTEPRTAVTMPATGDVASEPATTDVTRGSRAAEVWAAVAEYGNAIGARDLERLARVYPAMTDQQRRGWTAFFGSVTDLRAPLTIEQITVAGATAQVRVRAAYEYENLRPHHAERSVVNYKLTLARDATGWRIRTVE